ncbi:MAG: hypothetical protein GQF41_2250 [Candidatus Rifleibacterium amylolyticum]|nr:MAG: hypothetical protein GQF41_2250 [Candidatus Rifleibacterium amylolyticum]
MNFSAIRSRISCITAIAWYAFIEALRNRLFLGVFLLALPFAAAAWTVDVYQLGFQTRLVSDAGLTLISTLGLLVVLFFSLDQIIPDIEKRTVYFIFTRMPSRHTYMIGRFFGIVATLFCLHLFLAGLLVMIIKLRTGAWFNEIPVAGLIIFLKQSLLVSIVMLLAACTSKIITVSLSVLIYVIGHGLDIFRMLAEQSGNTIVAFLLDLTGIILPDFSLYETRIMVMHEIPAQTSALLILAFYTFTAIFFYLAVGGAILKRRDL